MKKITGLFICLLICAMLFTGCGLGQKEEETVQEIPNDEAVLGTWMEDDFDSGYIFSQDGTGKNIFWDLPFTYTAYDGSITITYDDDSYGLDKFSYTADDSQLVLTRQGNGGKTFTYTKR